jgi:hypothetical protein
MQAGEPGEQGEESAPEAEYRVGECESRSVAASDPDAACPHDDSQEDAEREGSER